MGQSIKGIGDIFVNILRNTGYQIKGNDACSNMVANILLISELKSEAAHDQLFFMRGYKLQIFRIKGCYLSQI